MTQENWTIQYYVNSTGKAPAKKFIESLPLKTKSKILRVFLYLMKYGLISEIPHLRKVANTKLWEIRVLGKDNVRVIFVAKGLRNIVVLHGFVKKSQKIPRKEINIALKRCGDS